MGFLCEEIVETLAGAKESEGQEDLMFFLNQNQSFAIIQDVGGNKYGTYLGFYLDDNWDGTFKVDI